MAKKANMTGARRSAKPASRAATKSSDARKRGTKLARKVTKPARQAAARKISAAKVRLGKPGKPARKMMRTLLVAAVSGFPTKPTKENFLIDVRDGKGQSVRLEMDHLTAQWLVEHMREQFRLRRIQ